MNLNCKIFIILCVSLYFRELHQGFEWEPYNMFTDLHKGNKLHALARSDSGHETHA